MWRLRFFIAGLVSALLAANTLAGDVPAPIKKPRDKNGVVITTPSPDKPAATANTADSVSKTDQTAKKIETAKPVSTTSPVSTPAPVPPAASKAAETPSPAVNVAPPAPPPIPKEWSAEEIELAKSHCTQVLKGVDAVSVPEPSFRDGECGAPAAVRLFSIGKSPQVTLDPPAVLTCDMVAALHTWMTKDIQQLAKKHLGTDVIKIQTMSDYACRKAYGRTNGKLSEHGRANALDVRGFVTAKAQPAYVLESWGPVQRDIIAAQVAAAKAAAENAAVAEAAASQAAAAAAKAANIEPVKAPAAAAETATPAAQLKKSLAASPASAPGAKSGAGGLSLGLVPSQLGGPKDKDKTKKSKGAERADAIPVQSGASGGATAIFLHAAHSAACRIFGTTLGPEANNDHRNHFHLDMAPRKTKKICD